MAINTINAEMVAKMFLGCLLYTSVASLPGSPSAILCLGKNTWRINNATGSVPCLHRREMFQMA